MQRGNKSAEKIADCKGIKRIMGKIKKRAGFTLIEVVIAMAIILIIVVSVLLMVTFASANLKESEGKEMAKNIAVYTMEFIRSRNVTYDNLLGHPLSDLGNDNSHYYPGLVDLWGDPLQSEGHPSDSTFPSYVNINPALPDETYNDKPEAFYYSLQGYVSLGDFDHLSSADPSPEDANAYICDFSTEHYHDKLYEVSPANDKNGHPMEGNHYIIRFPFNSTINNGSSPNPDAVRNFSADASYIPMIYTTDSNKTDNTSLEYDSHYTSDSGKEASTMAYRGFRVLTSIAARKKSLLDSDHVQYYDVKVTVLWVTQGKEHSYSLATQVVTYGGG